ncbi:hypothetical protein [Thermococcus waiotapuensis]|uniref:Uncharacterized protein n=1 Tax=Thermococcus waiotapuensis TaxID=90909 RepID=A0AAE4NUS0_9EURY|nr:hypothetical protein [Thermococcus waiotapuensis]MDV3103960.1 hypothetical protein [Thermococcus waiotapuensis]
MEAVTDSYGWNSGPILTPEAFEAIYSLWREIVEGLQLAVPHLVGRARVLNGVASVTEMDVVLHTEERLLTFREGNEVSFIVPVDPREGPEGIYLKLLHALEEQL